ncbi:hypothetical protein RB195_003719 [Necator americanus]|uniref:7TM GPCR serpentine receptor class x (Srx) domain-containing protein n=1 Tax=Necator americanus TaxID=51031 RepID=A0ABR1DPU7_NECAM
MCHVTLVPQRKEDLGRIRDSSEQNEVVFSFREHVIMAVVIALVAIIGAALNGRSAMLLLQLKSFQNPFGYLMILHSLSNFGLLLIFLTWAFPISLV